MYVISRAEKDDANYKLSAVYGFGIEISVLDLSMLVGSDYDDIRQSLTHENLPSRGLGQALPTSAGNAGIAVSRGPLVP